MSLVGQTIGKYEVLSELGRGGMGTVYKARDPLLDRLVAIKILAPQLANDQNFVQRFQLEAQSVARLSHPHIVGVYDAGFYDGGWMGQIPFLVMEFVEGGSLEKETRTGLPVPPKRLIQIITQVASALDYAAGRGFVHRDIKPANVLVDSESNLHLTDFGLVKAVGNSMTLTQGQIVGTPAYMAPEQIQGEEVLPQTDIYALGVVAYELMTGQVPFTGTMSSVFESHLRRQPPTPREVNPELPDAVEAVLNQALSKNPRERHASAGAFAQALQRAMLEPTVNLREEERPLPPPVAPTQVTAPPAMPPTQMVERPSTAPPPPAMPPTQMVERPSAAPPPPPPEAATRQMAQVAPPPPPPPAAAPTREMAAAAPARPAMPPPTAPPPPAAATKKGGPPLGLILGGVAVLLLLCVGAAIGGMALSRSGCGSASPTSAPVVGVQTPASDATATSAATATTEAEEPTPDLPAGAITALDAVPAGVLAIRTQGTFIDPAVGEVANAAGQGSGFLIDSSGLAVTNNHVVTGAGIIKVRVGDESAERSARVVAVSECSDLALLQVDGGGELPFLQWGSSGSVEAGDEIFTVGFPLDASEATVTKGVISKPQAAGDTSWASVRGVIQHDAAINFGSAGGPLVDGEGRVLGVNYATGSGDGQNFAIGADAARAVVELLADGEDQNSIGVNGVAVVDGSGLSGIWVASVKSGSPADDVGIRPGDILTHMEGLTLAEDGTMSTYCSILRSRGPDEVLDLDVLRFDTGELLSGQLNGRALEVVASGGGEEPSPTAAAEVNEELTSYSGFRLVSDNSEAIQVEVPNEWQDLNGNTWLFEDREVGAALSASGNLEAFNGTWSESGLFFAVSNVLVQELDEGALLDSFAPIFQEACENGGREPYSDAIFSGLMETWNNCNGEGTRNLVIAFTTEDRSVIGGLIFQMTQPADDEALQRILQSFNVIGPLP